MTYEDFHRWTVSKELERPDVADVMTEARRHIASLPRHVTGPGLSMATHNQADGMRNAYNALSAHNNGLALASHVSPHLRGAGYIQRSGDNGGWFDWLFGR